MTKNNVGCVRGTEAKWGGGWFGALLLLFGSWGGRRGGPLLLLYSNIIFVFFPASRAISNFTSRARAFWDYALASRAISNVTICTRACRDYAL